MITIETQSMGLDDCFRSNDEAVISVEEVQQFMADNYSDLKTELQVNKDGSNFCMTIRREERA